MSHKQKLSIPPGAISQIIADMLQDPQLPVKNPTEAFWQLPESPIAHHQSDQLQNFTTYAIIGSGITGCSVAKNLLELLSLESKATVTVLEARSLTSGATGRNGGHLLSPMPEEFTRLEEFFGRDEAIKIAAFANRTLDSVHTLANESAPELAKAAEARRVRSVVGYRSREMFEMAKKSHKRYEECFPQFKGDHEVFSGEDGLKESNIKEAVGVIASSAGAFWPYRLITGVFAHLLEQNQGRFSIETETPVTAIDYDPQNSGFPYTLTTSRGIMRATQVIHCTNGWTGHLLPQLRGKIFPFRGTMSTQQAGSNFPIEGNKKSWSTVDSQTYNATENTFCYGLYYITQNPHTGDIFIGGEKQKLDELFSGDDTKISEVSKRTLEAILPTVFDKGWEGAEKPNVRKVWSGIMGFTPDQMPWVGQIPTSVTGRKGDGEWIAAGYNGYGMPLCWGCGEAVAKMILGQHDDVRGWLPASFVISIKRLRSPYSTPEAAIIGLLEQSLSWSTTARLACRMAGRVVYKTLFDRTG